MGLPNRTVLALFIWVLFSSQPLWSQSQSTTGTIEGTVVDETAAVVLGAKVTLTHQSTGATRTLSTDTSGRYTAPLLQVGNYDVTVQLAGFTTVKRTGIALALGQSLTVDVTLKLASVETTVEVTAAAPLIETSRSEASSLIDTNQVSNLPLNGRRFFDLAFLTPGVYQERERNNLSLSGRAASIATSTSMAPISISRFSAARGAVKGPTSLTSSVRKPSASSRWSVATSRLSSVAQRAA